MTFLVAIAPLLALLVALLCGRFPGESALERLRGSVRAARRLAAPASSQPSPVDARPSRGGRLIATSLAGRAPPLGSG